MSSTTQPKIVKSAMRALQLFELFSEQKQPLSLGEISNLLQSPKSSCHELLHTLVHMGFMIPLNKGRTYYPSKRLYTMAETIAEFNPIKESIHQQLRALRDTTGETVVIGRLQAEQAVYLEVFEGTQAIRFNGNAGDLWPLHASAMGLSLLLGITGVERTELFSQMSLTRYTPATLTRKKDLLARLECDFPKIFLCHEEAQKDVSDIAMPLQVQGNLLSVGLVGPSFRFKQNADEYARALQFAVESIAY